MSLMTYPGSGTGSWVVTHAAITIRMSLSLCWFQCPMGALQLTGTRGGACFPSLGAEATDEVISAPAGPPALSHAEKSRGSRPGFNHTFSVYSEGGKGPLRDRWFIKH